LPRQVFLLRQPEGLAFEPLPFFIDYVQDLYFRYYERDRKPAVLVSWSDPDEQPGIDFVHDGRDYYAAHVGPRLERRVGALGGAEWLGGWAGHYELSPDKSAIVGDVPGKPGIHNLSGLSAHGVMQSRALGEALAGWIADGRWPDGLNLDALSETRFTSAPGGSEKMYV
jgi:sarcosine oxidase subunit beta